MRAKLAIPILAVGILALAGFAVYAQEESAADRVITSNVTVVIAPTTVTDRDGRYVHDLKPSQFTLFDNDKPQQITVDESFAPISLVVAIQADAKVESVLPKLQRIGSLLTNLMAGEQGEVAILAFDHRLQVLQDFTTDTNKVEAGLKKLKPGSSSSRMIDAVEQASRMLKSRSKERRRIVLLIAESRDKGSEGRLRESLATTQINNVLVYALNISRAYTETMTAPAIPRPDPIPPGARHVPAGAVNTPTSNAQLTGSQGYGANFVPLFTEIFRDVKGIFVDNPVEVFTKYTGGREMGFVTQKSLENAVSEIGREIHNQYLISYNPNNKLEGGFHTIRVEINGNYNIRTRPGYWLAAVNGQ
ncbi:MAG: VWA domain-containing protein [Bryobacteraceae bacterium]